MLLMVGIGVIAVWSYVSSQAPRMTVGFFLGAILVSTYCLLMGLVMLPIGIVTAIRRERNKLVLQCPACGLRSTESRQPFRVERLSFVEYSMVTCPRCKWEFTVDKYAKLA